MRLSPLHELYDLGADSEETTNLAEQLEGNVDEYQRRILDLLPGKQYGGYENNDQADINQDQELIEQLRSPGYLQ